MALRRVADVRMEVFVFGTHLTRVTRELAGREPDVALARVSAMVTGDRSGGSRMGGKPLRTFNETWARRVLRSSGVIIIVSDGWESWRPGARAA